jgi:hypothetical protein
MPLPSQYRAEHNARSAELRKWDSSVHILFQRVLLLSFYFVFFSLKLTILKGVVVDGWVGFEFRRRGQPNFFCGNVANPVTRISGPEKVLEILPLSRGQIRQTLLIVNILQLFNQLRRA